MDNDRPQIGGTADRPLTLDSRTGIVDPTGDTPLAVSEDELRIYIVVRKDLEPPMSVGKFGAQCAHAALTAWALCLDRDAARADHYIKRSQAKIVLEVKNEEELRSLYTKVHEAGFVAALIKDAGRTEFVEPTLTCLGIGPIWFRSEGKALLRRIQLYKD